MRTTGLFVLAIAAVATALSSSRASAQAAPNTSGTAVIRGVVRDAAGLPLSGVDLQLDAGRRGVESDSLGRYVLAAVEPGEHRLRLLRIGYRPDSTRVVVAAGETRHLDLVLIWAVQVLDAVVVAGEREKVGPLAGFYERKRQGMGRYFSAADIQRRRAVDLAQLLLMIPGVEVSGGRTSSRRVRFRGERELPDIFVDGVAFGPDVIDLSHFDVDNIAGLEVYRGAGMVPPAFMLGRTTAVSAGVIAIWTKHQDPVTRVPKRGEPTAARRVRELLSSGGAFAAADVDAVVELREETMARPQYPESLFVDGVAGVVLAEFVVDSAGRPMPQTFSIVLATHNDFAIAVRRAVLAQRYTPARKSGKPVAQVVQQPFQFVPPPRPSETRSER
ncbi:MAG: carboxypeptidase regulatory-like domain-containing protein [Gemmatimonadaceae bacterium]